MSALFEKTTIKGLELKNRLIRSATHEGMSDEKGFPTPSLFNLYGKLAKGGVGLIITGSAFVSRDGKSPFLGMQGIDSDEHILKYRELVEYVHQKGAKIAMQIVHCGRQTTREAIGCQPIAPSRVREKCLFSTPKKMTEEDIERIIEAFARASWRVKESGFDAVQIHGAHGYLINQFLSPYTNRRKDRWGGSIKNRMRFVREIYNRCRRQVGYNYPIFIKINGYDNIKAGLKINESVVMAEMMDKMGFDAIEVSCGIMESGLTMARGEIPFDVYLNEWKIYKNNPPLFKFIVKHLGKKFVKSPPLVHAYNQESARAIKNMVKAPVFLTGGIFDPIKMKRIITNKEADYISLSRALIAGPEFPEKIRKGNYELSRCIHCNLCIGYSFSKPLYCYRGKRYVNF